MVNCLRENMRWGRLTVQEGDCAPNRGEIRLPVTGRILSPGAPSLFPLCS